MMACDVERAPNDQKDTGWSGESWVMKSVLCGQEGEEKTWEHHVAWGRVDILTVWWPLCITKGFASIIFLLFRYDIVNHNTEASHALIQSLHLIMFRHHLQNTNMSPKHHQCQWTHAGQHQTPSTNGCGVDASCQCHQEGCFMRFGIHCEDVRPPNKRWSAKSGK